MEQKIIEIISSALIESAKKGASPDRVGQKIVKAIFSDDEIRENILDQVNSKWKTYCASKDLPLSNYSVYGELANKGSVLYNLSKERHNIDDYIKCTTKPAMRLSEQIVKTIEKAPKISMEELEAACEEKPSNMASSVISTETINKLADARLASELDISMEELEKIYEAKSEKHISMDELEKICEEDSSPAPTSISDIMSNLEKIERESAEYEYGSISDDTYELIKEDRKNNMSEEEEDF